MASGAVLWFGDEMSAVPLRNNKPAASAVRSVTVLGATGSIGDSTMDLLRGARDRYRVEALTANSNVDGLAKLAREFDARFAARTDHPTQAKMLVSSKTMRTHMEKLCCSSKSFLTMVTGSIEVSELIIPGPYTARHVLDHVESM